MIYDSIFLNERAALKKTALLFTIPCAILPIVMATGGLMSLPFEPMLFKFDFILYGVIYLIYVYGLILSWSIHKKLQPALIFTVHVTSLTYYILNGQAEWAGYITVFSIIATSAANQYFRVGEGECTECASTFNTDNILLKNNKGVRNRD